METSKDKIMSREEMVRRYYKQPDHLPEALQKQLQKDLGPKESIQLFAFVDLNEKFHLAEDWLVLTNNYLILAKRNLIVKTNGAEEAHSFYLDKVERSEIKAVKEVAGLSCQRLLIEGEYGKLLLSLQYSHRQSRNVGTIKFVLEQVLEKKSEKVLALQKNADEIYLDNLLQPITEAQSAITGNRMDVVWRLLTFLKPYKKRVAMGMGGAILMTLVSLLPAFLTGHFVDEVIKPLQSGKLGLQEAKDVSFLIIGGLVTIYLLREFFAWIRLRTMSVMGELVARDLRTQVYTHLQKLSLNFFSSKQTGSIISRVGSDTDRIWDFVAFGVVEVTTSVIMLIGLSSVLMFLDWKLGLLVMTPVPVILYIIFLHGQQMQKLFLRAWRKWSNLTDCLSDTIPGIRVVKAFNRESYETDRFVARNEAVVGEFNNIHRTWTKFWPFLMLGIQTIVVSVWIFGVPRVFEHVSVFAATGENAGLSPGVFISFLLYLGMFVQPIEIIGQMARMVNRATSSAHRVFEVLDTEPQVFEVNQPVTLNPLRGEVEFKDVLFSYDGVRKILKGVSFKVEPGEMIGLVGPSGSGKTTIINLLARFYDTSSGTINIDGVNLKDLELGSYRQQLGMVLQDPYLFHGSILENIRYAFPEATLDQVIEAAKAANAHEFIVKLPHAYDTIVGERGQSLSGGERQRVSIARAILRNPKILILDEATSAVDTETERKIQQALDRLVSGRTTIAIAHRLSTLTRADRLLVVQQGHLVESGKHEELMKIENGVYKKLVEMQQDLHGHQGLQLA